MFEHFHEFTPQVQNRILFMIMAVCIAVVIGIVAIVKTIMRSIVKMKQAEYEEEDPIVKTIEKVIQ